MTLEFLIFELNETKMALPVEAVASIYEAVAFHPRKEGGFGFLGDFNLHGLMIPVINLDRHWYRASNPLNLESQIIVVHCQGKKLALVADTVKGTILVEEEKVIELKDILPSDTEGQNPHRLTTHANEIYFILNIESLYDSAREVSLHA